MFKHIINIHVQLRMSGELWPWGAQRRSVRRQEWWGKQTPQPVSSFHLTRFTSRDTRIRNNNRRWRTVTYIYTPAATTSRVRRIRCTFVSCTILQSTIQTMPKYMYDKEIGWIIFCLLLLFFYCSACNK